MFKQLNEKNECNPCFSYFCVTDHRDIEQLTGRIFYGNIKAPESIFLIFAMQKPDEVKNFLEEKSLQDGYTLKWHWMDDDGQPDNPFELLYTAEELRQLTDKKIVSVVYWFKS